MYAPGSPGVRRPKCVDPVPWYGCYEILLVPTLNLLRGGEVVKQVIGAKSKSALLREFAEFLEPDRVPG